MKIRLNIQQKIQFYVLITTLIIFIVSIGYISWQSHKSSLRETKLLIDSHSAKNAESVKNIFNQDFAVIRTLAQAFHVHKDMEVEEWKELFNKIYFEIYRNNPHFHALWDSWEYSYYLPDWDLPYGRHLSYFYRENGEIQYQELERSLDGDPDLYGAAKAAGKETIWEPYLDRIATEGITAYLMSTLTVPMFDDGEYIGLVGLDITLESLQEIVNNIRPYEGSYAFIISYNGNYAAHPNSGLLEQSIDNHIPEDVYEHNILEKIQNGEQFSFESSTENDKTYYYTFSPIKIGKTGTPWSIGIAVPNDEIRAAALRSLIISLLIGLIGIILIAIVISIISRKISNPIHKVTQIMNKIASGKIDESMKLNIKTGDELEEMGNAFNVSIDGLINKAEFATSIGQGDMDCEVKLLSNEDKLGQALQEMQNHLKKAREEEKLRKIEEEKRNWINRGLAKFNDILRLNHDNIEKLSFNIIQNLINYLEANQGGIFVLEDSNPQDIYLDLKACYAYDRQKFINKKIKIGEGLVGACYLEKKPIYLTDIPETYTKIASGLGEENPNSLLIVPLKSNDVINGILEIASFNKFEEYQIEFIEKVAESIASTISNAKIAARTTQLLEQSQHQAEEMKAQEEEMRQNMEELAATQEEMGRKTNEMEGVFNALNVSSYIAEYDLSGKVINISNSFLKLLNITEEQALNSHHSKDMDFSDEQKQNYDDFWNDLINGKTQRQTVKLNVNGKTYYLAETYTPIYDEEGNPVKIFKIANDITEAKIQAEKHQKQYKELNDQLNACINDKEKLEEEIKRIQNRNKKK
ncbi:MAG: cache domain-containing protein [Bacteroidota bacterium]